MTLAKFNIILGFEIDASILTEDYCWAKLGAYEGYTGANTWMKITCQGGYKAQHSKASQIRYPILRAIQKWLSGFLHCRKNSDGVVTNRDAYLTRGHRCNVGYMYLQATPRPHHHWCFHCQVGTLPGL